MSILWITTEKGFYWNMKAEFLNFEATTSLIFTKLFSCKKFNVDGSFVYPLTWNGEQTWTIDYAFTKANAWFVWDHKRLFTDLINDWIGDDPSDISKFVPFRVHNRMKVVDGFEVRYFWISKCKKSGKLRFLELQNKKIRNFAFSSKQKSNFLGSKSVEIFFFGAILSSLCSFKKKIGIMFVL